MSSGDKIPAHPAAEVFPLLKGADFEALVDDVRAHGLRQPITLHDGAILDGRNRYKACLQAGVEPRFETYDGDNPVAYVVSANLKRRHLDASQRAMIAERLAKIEWGVNQHTQEEGQICLSDAARLMNVSVRSIKNARTVRRHGTLEEVAEIERGEASVSGTAKRIRERRGETARTGRRPARVAENPDGQPHGAAQPAAAGTSGAEAEIGEAPANDGITVLDTPLAQMTAERDGWRKRAKTAQAERAELARQLEDSHAELGRLRRRCETLEAELAAASETAGAAPTPAPAPAVRQGTAAGATPQPSARPAASPGGIDMPPIPPFLRRTPTTGAS